MLDPGLVFQDSSKKPSLPQRHPEPSPLLWTDWGWGTGGRRQWPCQLYCPGLPSLQGLVALMNICVRPVCPVAQCLTSSVEEGGILSHFSAQTGQARAHTCPGQRERAGPVCSSPGIALSAPLLLLWACPFRVNWAVPVHVRWPPWPRAPAFQLALSIQTWTSSRAGGCWPRLVGKGGGL